MWGRVSRDRADLRVVYAECPSASGGVAGDSQILRRRSTGSHISAWIPNSCWRVQVKAWRSVTTLPPAHPMTVHACVSHDRIASGLVACLLVCASMYSHAYTQFPSSVHTGLPRCKGASWIV